MSFVSLTRNSALSTMAQPDVEVSNPPTDSISAIAFSPQADYLAVSSWDHSVRVYEVGPAGQTVGKAMYNHEGPTLSVCWNKDGSRIFSSGADNKALMYDLATGQSSQVAQHDAPIKSCKWADMQSGVLITGGWDKTVKFWDLRTPSPIGTIQLPDRCYSLDVQFPLMVAGTAERHIEVFNLNNPTSVYKSIISPLKWQTRVISCLSPSRFAVGSVEGRVAIQYVDDKDAKDSFSFRCHRRDSTATAKDQSLVYAVNDISCHPIHGTVSTCGADGTFHYWDIDARTRLKSFEAVNGTISSGTFNRIGTVFAYAVSYDWSKGYTGMTPDHPNKVMIHACKDEEVKKKTRR